MTTIILDLPDDIVEQARHAGLLSSSAIATLLRQVIAQRQEKTVSLIEVMQNSPYKEIELTQVEPEYSSIREINL
ncbi:MULTISPECIES: hypothetical protein [unclassified Acinetobacter]|uniref:Antitoxin n=1 Tax=Acinetobacter corruptisaponis TaxID=3045147 RepID=A0ABY8S841_9GAMM|nr:MULTISPECIES: hypothetical protein [unclassified Acinetobacter]MDH0032184.1 hypothetical protein [Acinetobacter sp. GD04021]MDH0886041.1 hypothetical protein [Acinetobacter sp. GD03873]MDH1082661.1 hypothetical protein [Acinetobacter sp. GD03983]MDH2189544.1 hypothetical protein [Acinetobacter sp. GD03645]MDH2203625.1 hypothetical protein [Acinetobacter sp. GD03647]